MNSLDRYLSAALLPASRGLRPALMTHVVLGYPTLARSMEIVQTMADCGVSLIELQIPFSDPLADGPTIMRACEQALQNGVTPPDCIKAMERLSRSVSVPLIFMSYFNIPYSYGRRGLCDFLADAASAGAQGLIVPDVPLEERQEKYWSLPLDYGITPIPLVSPMTTPERLRHIAAAAPHGFVYCMAAAGTTGARRNLAAGLDGYLQRVRRCFKQPLAVGFGISNEDHVAALSGKAEIAIVGSAAIDVIARSDSSSGLAAVRRFVKRLVG